MKESLYDQIKLSLLLSELTYALSLVRELARRNQLDGDDNEAALQLPMSASEFQRIINNNPKLTSIFEGQNEDAAMQFSGGRSDERGGNDAHEKRSSLVDERL